MSNSEITGAGVEFIGNAWSAWIRHRKDRTVYIGMVPRLERG